MAIIIIISITIIIISENIKIRANTSNNDGHSLSQTCGLKHKGGSICKGKRVLIQSRDHTWIAATRAAEVRNDIDIGGRSGRRRVVLVP